MKPGFVIDRSGRSFALLAALVAFGAGGCVGAVATGSPEMATPRASASAASPATAAASQIVAPKALSPTATADSLASVPQAPSGAWRSIYWTALPTGTMQVLGSTAPADPSPTDAEAPGPQFQVFGWSHGYVGFTVESVESTVDAAGLIVYPEPTVVASYSSDGVHWHVGQKLDLAAAGSHLLVMIRSVIEGPDGLLAVGWSSACGSENLDSLWTSSDGIAWHPVDANKAFGDTTGITHVSGGAAGFVAVAYKSGGAWTSKDGRTWRRVALTRGVFKNALVNDGTTVSGGFLLAGTAGTRDCGTTTGDGSTPAPIFRTASVWWSTDGTAWSHVSLPGAVPSSAFQDTWVCRVSDRAVIVVNDISGAGRSAWGSNDGRTWRALPFADDIGMRDVISDGHRSLVMEPVPDDFTSGPIRLRTIDDTLTVASVAQSGELPQLVLSSLPYGSLAMGPTGVVVSNFDGSRLWFGAPSAQ